MNKVGRPKGYAKTGGRKKGTPNKRTRLGGDDALLNLVKLMEDPKRMAQELANLHGRDYFRVYFDAQAYVRPKYSSIEFNGDVQVTNEVASRINALINTTNDEEEGDQ